MCRWLPFFGLLAVMALAGLLAASSYAQSPRRSDSVVKANVTAMKPDAHGVQIVTVTLDIEKGWFLYANPVNHSNDVFEVMRTKLTINTKAKSQVNVKYAPGKTIGDARDKIDIYEGVIKIEATVKRTMGDNSPLQVNIHVNALNLRVCGLAPGVIKLTIPEETK